MANINLAEIREAFKAVYDIFETDPRKEQDGVEFDYLGLFTVVVARAGGSNKAFASALEEECKPYRRALQLNVQGMDEKALELYQRVYARTIIKNIYGPKVNRVKSDPFDPEIAMVLFKELPALFAEVKDQAESIALFRKEAREADAKNS